MDPNAVVEIFRKTVTEHYTDFQGRVRRQEFWYYVIAYVVAYVVLAVVQSVFRSHVLTGLYTLGLLLPTLGISVRRLHDTDKTGWWVVLAAVPLVLLGLLTSFAMMTGAYGMMFLTATLLPILSLAAAALLIYWYAQPGTSGPNQYGPDPKGGAATTAAA
jgi:uncharacterized membrane protein YhaH (DUF805 family)